MKVITGSAVLWPIAARAQQSGRIRRVGVLTGRAEDAESLTWVETFRQRLKELGWSDGHNVRINLLADGDVQRWQTNAGNGGLCS
jgi:putative ABC transport system substrate-binding protein